MEFLSKILKIPKIPKNLEIVENSNKNYGNFCEIINFFLTVGKQRKEYKEYMEFLFLFISYNMEFLLKL